MKLRGPFVSEDGRLWSRVAWCLALVAASCMLVPAGSANAQQAPRTRVLRGVTVAPGRGFTLVDIHFNAELRYLSHTPGQRGRTLEIRFRLDPLSSPTDLTRSEVMEWRDRDVVGLVDVELDGDSGGNARLLVHFDKVLDFEVAQGNDLSRIRVAVQHAEPLPAPTETPDEAPLKGAPGSADKIDEIMAEGRKAMTAGDYRRAVLLFSKVLEDPTRASAPEAQEFLALAHQREGQLAHARAEYEEYLAQYPDADGAPRVRQRLQAMLTVKEGRRPQASRPRTAEGIFAHTFSGSLSQFYRANVLDTDVTGSETTNSSLDSDLFVASRHTRPGLSLRTNFAASYRHDLLGRTDASDATRITGAFVDASWLEGQYSLRAGRQSASGGGVLGRFDGVLAGTQLAEHLRLNLVTGFPVDFTDSNRVSTHRPFYGIRADTGTFLNHWDAQLFGIRQMIDGIEDRQAVGGQLRFSDLRGFGLALVDYDVSYSALNTAMFIANWRMTDATSVNALVDVRKSPVLTSFNAIQGQLVSSIEDLEEQIGERAIRDLADARTGSSRVVTLGLSHQLNPTWQLSGDVTLSTLSDTKATLLPQPIAATEGTGTEMFYSLRSTATNLLIEGSFTSLDLRYSDTSTAKRYSFGASGRYPVVEGLRVGPQALVERRDNDAAPDVWRYRPGLRIDYRWRRFTFELDGGVDLSDGSTNTGSGDQKDYFLNLGYRYDF